MTLASKLSVLLTAGGLLYSTASTAELIYYGALDPVVPPGSTHEVDMMPGRLTKLPVSWVWMGKKSVTSAHSIRFRAVCPANAKRSECDTGMLVSGSRCTVLCVPTLGKYNNDDPASGSPFGSLVYHSQDVGGSYVVQVFSQNRATSRIARIEWSLDGVTWSAVWDDPFTGAPNSIVAGSPQQVGGTVVRVGALQNGDGVEVRTASDGAGDDGTRLWLFTTSSTSKVPLFSDAAGGGDKDPRITVDDTWTNTNNYVLVGKDFRSPFSKTGIEIHVELVRTPIGTLDQERLVAMNGGVECNTATCVGSAVTLPRGRYYAYVNVRLPPYSAVGQFDPIENSPSNRASELGGRCPFYNRGQPNDRAFTLVLKRNGAVQGQPRHVPRALLGNDPSLDNPWHYIIAEIDSRGGDSWSLEVHNNRAIVHPQWKYIRNPDSTEIKVATFNVFYETPDVDARMQNAADLLGTRGDYTAAGGVNEREDQAPWQWEADVIGLQEIDNYSWAQTFLDRLKVRSGYSAESLDNWSMVYGNTEIGNWPAGIDDEVFYGPIFANSLVTPGIGTIHFSEADLLAAGCNSKWEESPLADYACPLGSVETAGYDWRYNRAVAARVAAKRMGGRDRPVAVFNWHLFHEATAFAQRETNVEEFIRRAKALLARVPSAFNVMEPTDPRRTDPRNGQNRLIILGDSNMRNHECGEFQWAIRRLREEFGYAVDVSAAFIDNQQRTWDMHFSGAPITDPQQGKMGNCQSPSWAQPHYGDAGLWGCPYHFHHMDDWTADKDFDSSYDADSWFPWWASASRGENFEGRGRDRLDVIFLVGRGWSTDDPILNYKVMSDRSNPSPANNEFGGGVEMWKGSSCAEGTVSSGYAPNVSIGGCGTSAGAPAILSDHKPVGARLRVYAR